MDLNKKIGLNIRAERKLQNLTIDELAEKCDFQSPYLSDVERGERNITLQTLSKIIYALGISPSKILIPRNSLDKPKSEHREELIQLFIDLLNDKSDEEILMLLNVSNEIFKTYKDN